MGKSYPMQAPQSNKTKREAPPVSKQKMDAQKAKKKRRQKNAKMLESRERKTT